ncbi:MAG: alpha/beta fold hydrolase [Candidatus Pacebacteria bacterium]|nr:alpha/beta fold hydrolase [Candidatus Paceibacterota bacterium]
MKETEKIFLMTADGKKIAGLFRKPENPSFWVIFIHMRPATKESWDEFAGELINKNIASLAIDLRGHGESDGGPSGYLNDENCNIKINDLKSAVIFLRSEGAEPENIIFIGASIGANLVLKFMSENKDFKTAILFSPGLNFKKVSGEEAAEKISSEQRILFISSRDDDRVLENELETQKLFDLVPLDAEKEIVVYEKGGHGSEILKTEELPEIKETIINFIINKNK